MQGRGGCRAQSCEGPGAWRGIGNLAGCLGRLGSDRVPASAVSKAAYTEPVGRRLLGVVGELCQLGGLVTSDAGRPAEAVRYYLAGVRAAHAAGDELVAASNLSSLAYQLSYTGDAREAVAVAASAVKGARGVAT